MRIKTTNIPTYKNFLNQVHYISEEVDEEILMQLLNKIRGLLINPFCMPHAIFAIDYQKKKYLFWDNDNKLGGFKSEVVLQEGPSIVQRLLDPKYFRAFDEILFPKLLETLKKEEGDIFMSFNFKAKRLDGSPMHIYQKGVYIVSPITRLPLMCVGLNMDISEFKTDGYIHHTIEKFDVGTQQMAIIDKSFFNPLVDEIKLTACEIRILNYLSDGFSSKLIADKLKISVNTINNHRQNILKKTNCKNVAELIAFALNAGIK